MMLPFVSIDTGAPVGMVTADSSTVMVPLTLVSATLPSSSLTFTEDDREKLRNAVRRYLQPFCEQASEPECNLQLVYICAPLRGNVEQNIEFARQRAREVFEAGEIPVCPHLMFPPIADPGNETEDQAAREMGLRLVALCQQVNAYGACTAGMREEIELAERFGIPVKYFEVEGKDNAE